MVILFLGISGCGKGTQAKLLSNSLNNIPVISTGDAVRWAASSDSPEGQLAVSQYTSKGMLVPDELVLSILKKYIAQFDLSKGFIIDSFPRRLEQIELLDEILVTMGENLAAVIYLETEENIALQRLSGRNVHDKNAGISRDDANEETIKERFDFFNKQTKPLIDVYEQRGILHIINNSGTINQVQEAILLSLRKSGLGVDF